MRILNRCDADWDSMIGDDTTRFCRACQKNVVNVDALDEEAFRALIASGRACVRGRALPDGTVLRALMLAGATAAAVAGNAGSLAWRPAPTVIPAEIVPLLTVEEREQLTSMGYISAPVYGPEAPPAVDPETLDQLRALGGYIE